jgi:plasmid stabilization system protein ParE
MKLVFTGQAQQSMDNSLLFLLEEQGVSPEKIERIREGIKLRARQLLKNPELGQREFHLAHLKRNHRRLIEGDFKIIYFTQGDSIFITDIFDSRQDPKKMRG